MSKSHRSSGPEVVVLPTTRVAVVETVGDPTHAGARAVPALYGAVYKLKFARKSERRDFAVGALRARWAGASLDSSGELVGARETWRGRWALPVPADVIAVVTEDPSIHLGVEDYYGLGPKRLDRRHR